MEFLELLRHHLPAYMLVALRANGMFLTAPLFGNASIPATTKIMLALAISFLVFPFIPNNEAQIPTNIMLFAVVAGLELVTGLMYGWASQLLFEGVVLAGQFVGLQMGFAQANVLNPVAETQRPLLSEVYFLLAMFIFFSMNGHHYLLIGFQKSFNAVPLGGFVFNGLVLERILFLFAQIFLVALVIAAPLCGILTLLDLIMGLIARTAPQMNILVLGFSIKIYVGLWSLILSFPFIAPYIHDELENMLGAILKLF